MSATAKDIWEIALIQGLGIVVDSSRASNLDSGETTRETRKGNIRRAIIARGLSHTTVPRYPFTFEEGFRKVYGEPLLDEGPR